MRALIEPFGAEPPDWMNNSDWALPGLVIVYLWKNVGFAALIYLAGLQGLPKELDEAAAIDGACDLDAVPLDQAAAACPDHVLPADHHGDRHLPGVRRDRGDDRWRPW